MVSKQLLQNSTQGLADGLKAPAWPKTALALVFLGLTWLAEIPLQAQVVIDKTCATCGRRELDSLNLHPRNVRVNQVGYLPQDDRKRAFVANATTTQFKVVDAATHTVVLTDNLQPAGTSTEGGLKITGYYNSINPLYSFQKPAAAVDLFLADFSKVTAPGRYFIVCGNDTSSTFAIDDQVYNIVFGETLKFFGAQRCGPSHSWFHKDCHLKDGSALGAGRAGELAGGWHDCGDHGKYSETEAYAAVVLALAYAYWPQKGEDLYGNSYNDTLPFGNDGIPDVLYEAKVGADYILKLYKASKKDGLIANGDMYHSVGTGPGFDHLYWDVPENQDAQPLTKGGPDRVVTKGIGSNVAGMFSATLAFFAWGWEPFDPAYSAECVAAAKDIYANIISKRRNTNTTNPCCYPGGGPTRDDEALAALSLWLTTKDTLYKYDLLDNPALGRSPNAQYNQGEFPYGLMAQSISGSGGVGPFMPGGWPTDYENTHVFTTYGLAKLIVDTPEKAAKYGLSAAVADSLKKDCIALLARTINDGTNGSQNVVPANPYTVHADPPYNGVYTSANWGYNRYNFGSALELFLYWDLTGNKDYLHIGMDNMNYELGLNPWDVSFIMGTGDRNLQHPHNRAANPEGYNAGGFPYDYKVPKGAFMGGCNPQNVLLDEWEKFDNTETCIDFSAQIVIPAQMLAADIPPDNEGPKYRNVNVIPEDVRATVAWTTDELSRDTLFLYDSPGGVLLQKVSPDMLSRNKQIVLTGLTPSTTYYFSFKGMDIRRNVSVDDNRGSYYRFTTLAGARPSAQISGVKVCNETHDQATVSWWTRNGQYDSRVDYDLATAAGKPSKERQPDDAGLPTVFHTVTVKDLNPATGYKYSVTSGSTTDDSSGGYYHFKTTQVLVNYDIRVKATNKAQQPGGFQMYIDITNNEQKPYTGVELRFYFSASASVAAGLIAKGNDNQLRGVGGSDIGIDIAYGTNGDGKPVALPGFTDIWYFPIVIKSTLPVAGRASIDLQIFTGNAWTTYPFSAMTNAWSVIPHASPPDPVAFDGVDFKPALSGQYTGPEPIEKINGVNTVTYIKNPYISAYYEGVHVYGYGPDYKVDVIQKKRMATLNLTAPVISPLDKLDIRQEQAPALMLAGKASVSPDGTVDEIWINGTQLPASSVTQAPDGSVTFSTPIAVAEGTNFQDVVAFDTEHCVFAAKKVAINWSKAPPPPPDTVKSVTANPPSKTSRDPITVSLSTTTSGATIWYTLDGADPKPGQAGTLKYQGAIVIGKDSVTLKAVATKADHISSGITTEKYAILPFRMVDVKAVLLLDRSGKALDGSKSQEYRDGYADVLALVLNRGEGDIDETQVLAQLNAATITGGFKLVSGSFAAALKAISGDTLFLPLEVNTQPVAEGLARLSLGLPTGVTPNDGMLAPGAYPARDAIAPVLRSAVLRLHEQFGGTAPDTLVVVFSEPLVKTGQTSTAPLQGKLFGLLDVSILSAGASASDSAAAQYAFTVGVGESRQTNLANVGEAAYGFLLTASSSANGAAVAAQAGDWIWIDPAAGLKDTSSNAQTSPKNRWVLLRIAHPLNLKVGPTVDGGVSHLSANLPSADDPTWSTVADGTDEFGSGDVRIKVRDKANPLQYGGIAVDATAPFKVFVRVFSNLGVSTTDIKLEVGETDFARLPVNLDGSRRLNLLWNGRAKSGQLVGTGAFVYSWQVSGIDDEGNIRSTKDQRIYGIMRGQ